MAYGTKILPQSGTYTLSWGIISSNAPLKQTPTSSGTSSITYGASKITVQNSNGTSSTYTYTESTIFYTSGTNSAIKFILFQLSGGGYFILADPSINVSSYTFTFNAAVNATQVGINDNSGGTLYSGYQKSAWSPVCFLTGTLISTPSGNILVEDIVPDTEVLAFDQDGNSVVKKVCWVGRNKVSIDSPAVLIKNDAFAENVPFKDCLTSPEIYLHKVSVDNPEFELEQYPVCIKKDAFAENVPFKDCLITPEHCLFIDGCFVPARMLVNDKSIYYDKTQTEYEYFHIELEDHSILCSDGIYSESYLRTNEIDFSSFEGTATSTVKTWAQDAAVPLNTTREFVEPIYQKLALRADVMGFPCVEKKISKALNTYIVDQYGNVVYPSKVSGNKYTFYLKNGSDNIDIRSCSGKPSEVVGPFVDDRRNLGLLIGEITLLTSDSFIKYTQHLEKEDLFGWHVRDCDTMRWTDGHAQLLNLGMTESCYIRIEILDQKPSVEKVSLTLGTSQDLEMIATVV